MGNLDEEVVTSDTEVEELASNNTELDYLW